MLNPIVYDSEDLEKIAQKKSNNFTADSWSDEDLKALKKKIKDHYLSEQDATCCYCKQKNRSTNGRVWDVEHIIPRATVPNFMFEPLNLCVSCVDCNNAKSDKKVSNSTAKVTYPTTSDRFLIVHPHLDVYEEYILVIQVGLFYYPKHSKGEKTIEYCRLNRFYEYAGYNGDVSVDDRILMLSNSLKNTSDDSARSEFLKEIAALAINSTAGSK